MIEVYGNVSFNATAAAETNPLTDSTPAFVMGFQALMSVMVWFTFLFVYTPKNGISSGIQALPLTWMWSNLTSGTQGWMAASYLSNFLVNMIVGLGELIAFLLF